MGKRLKMRENDWDKERKEGIERKRKKKRESKMKAFEKYA